MSVLEPPESYFVAGRWLPPHLEGPRVRLRGIGEEDAEAVFAYASNPNMTRFTLWETHQDLDDTLVFVRDYANSRYQNREPDPLGIVLKDDPAGAVVGTVGCFWGSKPNGTMELGYALAEPLWGQGLVVEAARVLLDYVFREYPVNRVQARVIQGNEQSAAVLRKLGMTPEGTLRGSLWRRGEYCDVLYFAVLRSEWAA